MAFSFKNSGGYEAPTNNQADFMVGSAIGDIGSSIGDFMKERKEEQKTVKRDADIVRFLAKKDPTLFGEDFDPQNMSERDMANLLGGIKEHIEIGKATAYQQQVELQKQRMMQDAEELKKSGQMQQVPGQPGLFILNGKTITQDSNTGAWIEVGDVPNYINSLRYGGQFNFGGSQGATGGYPTGEASVAEILSGGVPATGNAGSAQGIPPEIIERIVGQMQDINNPKATEVPINSLVGGVKGVSDSLWDYQKRNPVPVVSQVKGAIKRGVENVRDAFTGGNYGAVDVKGQVAVNKKIMDKMTAEQKEKLLKNLIETGQINLDSKKETNVQSSGRIKSIKQIK